MIRGIFRFHHERADWSIFHRQEISDALLPEIRSWRGDGILTRATGKKTIQLLRNMRVPLIDLRGSDQSYGVPGFQVDHEAISRMAFDHLASCGIKKFAYAGEPIGVHRYDTLRRDAFCKIVVSQGGTCQVCPRPKGLPSPVPWKLHQRQLVAWLHTLPKPVGIMCCHDDRAQKILDACHEAKISVPNEVAVIGVDNDEFVCQLTIPSLTSVEIKADRLGYEAAKLLDGMMKGEKEFNQARFFHPIAVVARQSTDLVACDDPEVAEAIRIIRQRACNHLTVASIEKHLAISRSMLNHRFKKVVGHSPKQEILRIQIETAKKQLIESSDPVYAIAEQMGFCDAKYFIAVFRKHVGVTPRSFRINATA